MMHIGWPEGIFLAWIAFALLNVAAKDGEPVDPPVHKFGLALIRAALLLGLTWWGGFFS